MAGRAGRRGKDDKGTSIICIDDSFGLICRVDEFDDMFSVNSKDVESQLKVTYKTNLQSSEGKDVSSMIQNSFFMNNSE